MTAFPTLISEASFSVGADTSTYLQLGDPTRGLLGTGTLAPGSDVWSPITAYVHSVTTQRGTSRVQSPVVRSEAGTSTTVVDNSDRRFDPTNLAGPYVSAGLTQVTPMRGLRHAATWDGVTYDLWRGYLDALPINYLQPLYASASFTATDAFKIFANRNRPGTGPVGTGELSGARINRILNSANWSAVDRQIATGDSTMQATTLAGDVLAELSLVADSEIGDLYMDAGGRVVWRNRQAALEELRSSRPMALFGDSFNLTESTTINLHTNPSLEVALTGWLGGGFANQPTLTLSTTRAQFGAQSALCTWATASLGDLPLAQCGNTVTGLRPGRSYTLSVYAYVPSGSPTVFAVISGVAFGTTTGGLVDQWVRLTATAVATTSSMTLQVWPQTAPTAGQQVWLDGAQVEEAAAVSAYCDGDQSGCEWDGIAHASSSRRLVELPYSDVTLDYDDTQLVNEANVSRAGGATQTATDALSKALYLTRTTERSDLLLQTDGDALNWANWVVYQSKDNELRFSQLVIDPQRDPARLYPQVLGRELGDRIRVRRRPPGGGATIERECFIRGIVHTIDCQRRTWRTTWTLQSATKWAFFMLGHQSLGVLGQNALAM